MHTHAPIRTISCAKRIQCLPGKRGRFASISARIQPTDHTSIDLVYPFEFSMISGALSEIEMNNQIISSNWSIWKIFPSLSSLVMHSGHSLFVWSNGDNLGNLLVNCLRLFMRGNMLSCAGMRYQSSCRLDLKLSL